MDIYGLSRAKQVLRNTKRRINHARNLISDHGSKLLVMVYHRVLPHASFDPFRAVVLYDTFVRQVRMLAKRYPIISLRDAVGQLRSGCLKERLQVVLTFDDGYRECYSLVFPLLKSEHVPATFFLATDYVGASKPLWEWEVMTALFLNPGIKSIAVNSGLIKKGRLESHVAFAKRIFFILKYSFPGEIQNVLDFLSKARRNGRYLDPVHDICITWDEANTICRNGMDIGSHGISHRSLAHMPLEEAVREMRESKEVIEKKTLKPCHDFAFPFGSRRDYNHALIECAKSVGFDSCLLNRHGHNHVEDSPFLLKRIIMDESFDPDFILG